MYEMEYRMVLPKIPKYLDEDAAAKWFFQEFRDELILKLAADLYLNVKQKQEAYHIGYIVVNAKLELANELVVKTGLEKLVQSARNIDD